MNDKLCKCKDFFADPFKPPTYIDKLNNYRCGRCKGLMFKPIAPTPVEALYTSVGDAIKIDTKRVLNYITYNPKKAMLYSLIVGVIITTLYNFAIM